MDIPQLIAHRGYPRRYPENTLEGIAAAIKAGACFVEFDVQLTADGVPVLLHDVSLMRTTGTRGRIVNTDLEKLRDLPANEPERFGKRYRTFTIPTLAAVVDLLKQHPRVVPFVELKEESLEKHGREYAVKTLLAVLNPILARCVVISYDILSLRTARAMGAKRIGWVMKNWNEDTLTRATELVPDFLICNYTKLPKAPAPLWHGPWKWVFYEVTQAKLAMQLAARGATMIETMAIAEMLKNPQLRRGGCFD
jgi:glycerophosphoryl diester phosphodiesterase